MAANDEALKATPETKDLDGLEGWLILVSIGIVFGPVRLLVSAIPYYLELFKPESWQSLMAAASLHPWMMWYIGGEVLLNVILMMVSLILVFLFFTKNRRFPKWFIGFLLLSLVVSFAAPAVNYFGFPDEPVWEPEATKNTLGAVIACLLWIPYMLISKRVKMTFRDRSI